MFWQENIKEESFKIPEKVVDLSFRIESKILPFEHSFLLKEAICKYISYKDYNFSLLNIGIASGNGWQQNESDIFYPSKRSKLTIRIYKKDLSIYQSLVGKTLELGEFKIKIVKDLGIKKLKDNSVLFSKKIVYDSHIDETIFLQECFESLQKLNINPKKMIAGLKREVKYKDTTLLVRSLMVADLKKSESVTLQEQGIGDYQLLGCGIFVPQKGIDSVDAV